MMRSHKRRPGASMYYSLAEYAYVILFLTIGISAFLHAENNRQREENEELERRLAQQHLTIQELQFELEKLREKEKAQLPCDAIEGPEIGNIVGVLTIKSTAAFEIVSVESSETRSIENIREALALAVLRDTVNEMFGELMSFADTNECFLRIRLLNETNDHSLYLKYKSALGVSGMVIVD